MAIDESRNGNTDPDRRAAIRKCFGTNFNPLPQANTIRVSQPTVVQDIPASLPSSFTPQANNLVGTVENSGDYTLEMNIVPTRNPNATWTEIVHFTMTGIGCCNFGDRMPGVWFYPGSLRLHVRIGDVRDGNWGIDPTSLCTLNQNNSLMVRCRGSTVTVRLNNEVITLTQPTRRPSGNARVFACLSNLPAAANISNFKYTNFPASVPIMFGSWIGTDFRVQNIFTLADGSRVYAIQQGVFTKMVHETTGTAKYYSGTLAQFNANNWNSYTVAPIGVYRIKFAIPVLFGPWIGPDQEAGRMFELSDGSKVYAIESDGYTKMVQESTGVGKYYTGRYSQFNRNSWNNYSTAPSGNYRLKFV